MLRSHIVAPAGDMRLAGGRVRSTGRPAGLIAVALLAAACGRSGLRAGGPDQPGTGASNDDGGGAADGQRGEDRAAPCQPSVEICNGIDDDCDGQTDEGLAPVPCPGGGSRICVAGRLSECPQRCEVCAPGSQRICLTTICTSWGVEICAGDGRSFGRCQERPVPAACAAIAADKGSSPELERCCIDSGYCCVDQFDLDGDGVRDEMLGRCDEVRCGS